LGEGWEYADAMTKQRDSYWDLWRGVAIIAVVSIHAKTGESYAGWEHDYGIVAKARPHRHITLIPVTRTPERNGTSYFRIS
jgi:hypothetical protein